MRFWKSSPAVWNIWFLFHKSVTHIVCHPNITATGQFRVILVTKLLYVHVPFVKELVHYLNLNWLQNFGIYCKRKKIELCINCMITSTTYTHQHQRPVYTCNIILCAINVSHSYHRQYFDESNMVLLHSWSIVVIHICWMYQLHLSWVYDFS